MPDALELLSDDHETVQQLFTTMGNTGDPRKRRELANTIIKELSVHAAIEEEVFYPAVAPRVEGGEGFTTVSLEEHAKAKEQMRKLDRMKPDEPSFDPAVGELIKEVKEHIADEELQLFPRVRAAFTSRELEELGAWMKERKGAVPTRPHPKASSKPPLNAVANRAAAPLDRARDEGRPGA